MASTNPASDVARALKDTHERQALAADPEASVWVSANAGTGKTHVLTMRTLRLLLAGTPPERILCLTYTKAAAAEMSARVFDWLGRWVTLSKSDLQSSLTELLQRPATTDELTRARTLFAFAIETPGGLKVQTIHAFCEQLLQRFPLEAGVPPAFSILDDDMVCTLQREAIDDVLREATSEPGSALGRALTTAVAFASDDRFDTLLASAIRERDYINAILSFDDDGGIDEGKPKDIDALLRDTLGVRPGIDTGVIDAELSSVMSEGDLQRLIGALADGTKSDQKLGDALRSAMGSAGSSGITNALMGYFLTDAGKARARLMTKGVKDAHPDLEAAVTKAQNQFFALVNERKCLRAIEATHALVRLASAVLQAYTDAKARRAGLDYEDLIEKSASLLASSENAAWVLFKLDGGLDHILVDESQDTSPAQWQIVEAIANEFFTGEGARDVKRTLFAVGDEKQSIYSFQGAAPEQFEAMGTRFEMLAKNAETRWHHVPLNLSFRTVPPVLQAVDRVFADRATTPGLGSDQNEITHVAARFGRGGLVEVWPTITTPDDPLDDAWLPGGETDTKTTAELLADKIADTIAAWLQTGERLNSEDRPVRESDILILVRKRNPFAGPMVAALKARGIPVAGADRIDLLQQIAVQDLVALGDFLVLPEDDLALACVLKSPLFGLDDDDLFRLAAGRRGTLWKALLDGRAFGKTFEDAAQTLLNWRKRADFLPPYEFFSDILDSGGMRTRFLARLGSEAAEPLDEFLNLMVAFDEGAPPSLAGFLSWLRSGKREIKRDMEQGTNQVRVMTVHGAKGLEAPIVFLPDTCTTGSGGNDSGLVTLDVSDLPSRFDDLKMWKVKGSGSLDAFRRAAELQKSADREERNRLLYVAMTRARDRLYVCGFEGKKARSPECWYDLVRGGVAPIASSHDDGAGGQLLRISAPQTFETPDAPKSLVSQEEAPRPPPAWAHRTAPVERELAVPLAPSKLAPYDIDEEGEPVGVDSRVMDPSAPDAGTTELAQSGGGLPVPVEPPTAPARVAEDERRFLRGTITHALLEHLPGLARDLRSEVAKNYVATRGAALSPRVRKTIVAEALLILDHREFGALFGENSQAEVAIGADIPPPDGTGPPLRLSGFIDRLAIVGDEILIVDYKTNRPPPDALEHVADAYLFQLAAYQLALSTIYPGKTTRAAILWTQTARLMEIPGPVLRQYGAKLWELAPRAS